MRFRSSATAAAAFLVILSTGESADVVIGSLPERSGFVQIQLGRKGTEKPLEPPEFWTTILNDEKVETRRRGLACYFLFDRFVSQDATLGELAKAVSPPTWIKKKNVNFVNAIFGSDPPLDFVSGATMFSINVCSDKDVETRNKDCLQVWINVEGAKFKYEDFFDAITAPDKSEFKNTKIRGWGISPPWAVYNKRIRKDFKF